MLAVAGETATEATGTGVTVTAALPVLASLVAVIVTVPTAPLVTSPLALTVATPDCCSSMSRTAQSTRRRRVLRVAAS